MPFKVPLNDRPSASAVDADSHPVARDAAQAEADRINAWTNPDFGGSGRHQLQKDASFYRPEKRQPGRPGE